MNLAYYANDANLQEAVVCYCCIQLHLGGLAGLVLDKFSPSDASSGTSSLMVGSLADSGVGHGNNLEELYEQVLRDKESDGKHR